MGVSSTCSPRTLICRTEFSSIGAWGKAPPMVRHLWLQDVSQGYHSNLLTSSLVNEDNLSFKYAAPEQRMMAT